LDAVPWFQADQRLEFRPKNQDRACRSDHYHVQAEDDADPQVHLKVELSHPQPLRPVDELAE
jgi:hypothetical protein